MLYVCKRFVSDLRTKLLVGGAWAFSVLASFPMFFISDEIEDGGKQCWIQLDSALQWKVRTVASSAGPSSTVRSSGR